MRRGRLCISYLLSYLLLLVLLIQSWEAWIKLVSEAASDVLLTLALRRPRDMIQGRKRKHLMLVRKKCHPPLLSSLWFRRGYETNLPPASAALSTTGSSMTQGEHSRRIAPNLAVIGPLSQAVKP